MDIEANRKQQNYTAGEQLKRVIWGCCKPLFHFSWRPLFGWRNFLLRCFGAKIGKAVHIYPSADIYFPWNLEIGDHSSIGEHARIYNLGKVSIGKETTISQYAHLCAGTHDYSDKSMPLIKSEIKIEDQAWVCADAFIGPDVTVKEGAVIGARAVVVKDTDAWTVYAGNPAKAIKKREFND